MRFIDVSVTLELGMTIYPGDVPFSRVELKSMEAGEHVNLSELRMGAHSGTHVDSPYHFLPEGRSLEELPVDAFTGPAAVLPLEDVPSSIGEEEIAPFQLEKGDIVLLKTRNSEWLGSPFRHDYIYLSEEGAKSLAASGVKAVGIDYLSIEGFRVEGFPVHRFLLRKGIGIIEGLNLSGVDPGRYWLICLPMKVGGGDGAPARAILVEGWPEI